MAPLSTSLYQNTWQQQQPPIGDRFEQRRYPAAAGPKLMEAEIQLVLDLTRRGHEEHRAGNTSAALALMNEALMLVERSMPESLEAAVILTSIARILQESGTANSGFKQHWSALQIRIKLQPNTAIEAESQEQVGIILLSEHQHVAALKHLQSALFFHMGQNSTSIVTAIQHIHVGQARQNMGQLMEALISFERALSILTHLKPDSVNVANVHCLLGRVLREQGNLEAAKEQLNQAIAIFNAQVPSSLDLANAFVDLGRVYASSDEEEEEGCAGNKEMFYYGKALEIQNALAPDSLEVANTSHHVGISKFRVGDFESAQAYLQRAISIRESLSPQSIELARSFFSLAELLSKQGDHENALRLHQRALERRSRLQPLSRDEADSLHAVGEIMENMGNWKDALGYYSREFLGRDIDAIETARVHNAIGNILLEKANRIGDAVSNHRMAVRIQTPHQQGDGTKLEGPLVTYITDLVRALKIKGDESTVDLERQLEEAGNAFGAAS